MKRKAENPEYRKKINNQSFKKRKVKNSEPMSQIKRNYVKVKKTVMSVHRIAQCAKTQYQNAHGASTPFVLEIVLSITMSIKQ